MPNKFKRTIDELREVASMFWPAELSRKEAELSIIPKLIETQNQFISILSVEVPTIYQLFKIIDASKMPGNLFVKHLVVLSDFGGEMIQRINRQFTSIFPNKNMKYIWQEKQYEYQFKILPVTGILNNDKLAISGKKLLDKRPLDALLQDIIAILIFGSTIVVENSANILAKCEIGLYLGNAGKLETFIKQRYIWVSRITGGAMVNSLGAIAQDFVKEFLKTKLRIPGVSVKSGKIPGIMHTEELSTTFDIVVTDNKKYVAIEVGFQVTTNSVIERKAGQAKARYEQIEAKGYKIAYVIDGAGNFQRENAVSTLCTYSHCNIAFSNSELEVLCEFLRSYFSGKL